MLNPRALFLGGSALVGAAAIAGAALAIRAKWYTRPSPDVIGWLKANALPLASTEPGSSFQDLEQLRPLIGEARIVSLGEAHSWHPGILSAQASHDRILRIAARLHH